MIFLKYSKDRLLCCGKIEKILQQSVQLLLDKAE